MKVLQIKKQPIIENINFTQKKKYSYDDRATTREVHPDRF